MFQRVHIYGLKSHRFSIYRVWFRKAAKLTQRRCLTWPVFYLLMGIIAPRKEAMICSKNSFEKRDAGQKSVL
jgi:hypothetical protein